MRIDEPDCLSDAALPAALGKACGGDERAGRWAWAAQQRDRLALDLRVVPGNRIEVGLWWNREGGRPDVQLIFGLYRHAVELGSLRGNGFDAPAFHHAGFGTLLVNTAVQALQRHCEPPLRVEGVLSNTDELSLPEAQRLRLEEGRRAFWRRFGLQIVARGTPPLDYLSGRIADLRTVTHGQVAGQFERCVPLAQFEALA
jgi:hypothetical protein